MLSLVRSAIDSIRRALPFPNTITRLDSWIDMWAFGSPSDSGVTVTEQSAMELSAVWACVRAISEDVASIPLYTYRRLYDDPSASIQRTAPRRPTGRNLAYDYPLYSILQESFNEEMTALQGRELMQSHLLTWGNAYALIQWDKAMRPYALWPIAPDRMKVSRDKQTQKVRYEVIVDAGTILQIKPEDCLHIHGLGYDGLVGYSPIRLARNILGLARGQEQFGAKLFAQGVRPSGVLETAGQLSEQSRANLKESFTAAYAGVQNAHRVIVLEEGLTFKPMMLPPQDVQFIEGRGYQTEEVARWFRMPAMMIGHPTKTATFSSTEQFFLSYIIHTLRPWTRRWEAEIHLKLVPERSTRNIFVEHDLKELLRGNIKDLGSYYKEMVNLGVMSPNEVREREGMNPVAGGNVFFRPLNTAYVDEEGQIQALIQPSNVQDPIVGTGEAYEDPIPDQPVEDEEEPEEEPVNAGN